MTEFGKELLKRIERVERLPHIKTCFPLSKECGFMFCYENPIFSNPSPFGFKEFKSCDDIKLCIEENGYPDRNEHLWRR